MKKSLLFLTILILIVAGFAVTSYAEDKTVTGLGTGAIGNPDSTNGGGWSYVWYGKYGGNPVRYRVLDKAATEFGGNTLLLDCDEILIKMKHSNESTDYSWANSLINAWLNGNDFYKNTDVFSEPERNAITASIKSDFSRDGKKWFLYSGESQPLTGENIFLLDAREVTRAGYGYTFDHRNKTGVIDMGHFSWWLRTPSRDHTNEEDRACLIEDGDCEESGIRSSSGVSPAFNLDLKRIIFSSLTAGTPGQTGAEYKLTISDDDLSIAVQDGKKVARTRDIVTVPYSITGENASLVNRISVLITDEKYVPGKAVSENYIYLEPETDIEPGAGIFTLPAGYSDKVCGRDYYAYIIAEEVNGEKETDYAGAPAEITIPVKGDDPPSAYDRYLVTDTDTLETLPDKVVRFNNIDWYIIKDDSLAVDAGILTLFVKEPIGASKFDKSNTADNKYSDSTVRSYLDGLTAGEGSFADAAKAILEKNLSDVGVKGAKLWLLSKKEAGELNENVRKCEKTAGAHYYYWWLRSPGDADGTAVCVKHEGNVVGEEWDVGNILSVRPALRLSLSSVFFESESKSFIVKHSVTVKPGSNMTKTTDSGDAKQSVVGAITDVVFTANKGYYFPIDYSVDSVNGISVSRNSYTKITVFGTPNDDSEITLTAPAAKTKPDAPAAATAVNCTSESNNDGKLIGVTTAMEYKKSDADSWSDGTGSDIEGLVPGTYYVRLKETDTTLASDNQVLTIAAYNEGEDDPDDPALKPAPKTPWENAIEAMNKGFAAPGDTTALIKKGKKYFLVTDKDCQITVVKGNKFFISDIEGRAEFDKRYEKLLSISKKGKASAKKAADDLHFSFNNKKAGKKVTVSINIIEPEIKDGKLKGEAKAGEAFDFVTTIPLNAKFETPKNKGVADGLIYSGVDAIGIDGKIHIKGTALKKGKVAIPFTVYGKKFKAVIKVKS